MQTSGQVRSHMWQAMHFQSLGVGHQVAALAALCANGEDTLLQARTQRPQPLHHMLSISILTSMPPPSFSACTSHSSSRVSST